MPGNSSRRGAIRKPGSKKGAVAGSGGQKSKGLAGKGPTPKATERTGHPAARRAASSAKRAPVQPIQPRGGGQRGGSGRRDTGLEIVAGRNPVVEALRAGVPARALYVAARIDSDDRVKESL